jgi:hypothetical protein
MSAGNGPTREPLRRPENALVAGVVLVPGDPRALDVVVELGTGGPYCSLVHARVAVVTQTATTVRLRASGYEPVGPSGIVAACAGGGLRALRVRLLTPLAGRRIVDVGRTPEASFVPIDPSDYPAPSYLPPGYRLRAEHPISASRGQLVALRKYMSGDNVLEVRAGPADEMGGPLPVHVRHVDIDGHVGLLSLLEAARCITWPVAPSRDREVCIYPGRVNSFSTAQLLKVARSVH